MELQKFITEVVKINNQIKSVDEQLEKIKISRSQIRKIVADFERLQNFKMIRDNIENAEVIASVENGAIKCVIKVDGWTAQKVDAIIIEQIGFLETELMKYVPKEMPLGDGGGEYDSEYYAERKKFEDGFVTKPLKSSEDGMLTVNI